MADILAALYGRVMKIDPAQPQWAERDRFILSKGHGAAILYAVLAEMGFLPVSILDTYCQDGSILAGHASHKVPGVELSTGALGHGLPVGCGMAFAAKKDLKSWRVFVLLSDGEMDEGSNWEAILFAGHHKLDNLIAIVDHNRLQGFGEVRQVLDLEPLAEKLDAFRWATREIDGHSHNDILNVLSQLPVEPGKPTIIIAHTTKGKGVTFMENRLEWHYRSPDVDQLRAALSELELNG
jgi:transketolase